MDWEGMSYRPVHPLYRESTKEGLGSQAGTRVLPASAGTK